ncbi:MAG: EamA family transporter [Candidatus Pacearchaeota archaeon]
MFYLPIIGSLFEAIGTILEKKVLRKKNLNYKNYTTYEFLSLTFVMFPFTFFFTKIDPAFFSFKNILIFFIVVLLSVFANLLIFYSLKREDVSEFEPLWLMQSVFVIFLAYIFFPNERNLTFFLLGLVASSSLVFAHIEKKHLVFNKYIVVALIGSFLFACELVLSRTILIFFNPFSFYFLRCFFIFLICFMIFRPNGKELNKRYLLFILTIGIVWVLFRIIMYYGYLTLGIIFTTILFILSPVFVFLFAVFFLKEKPNKKQIISAIIIVICVVLALLFGADL